MMCAALYECLVDAISESEISYGRNDDTLIRPSNFVDLMETALFTAAADDQITLHLNGEEIARFRALINDVADLEKRDVVPYIAIGS